jgi:hypothetical protein
MASAAGPREPAAPRGSAPASPSSEGAPAHRPATGPGGAAPSLARAQAAQAGKEAAEAAATAGAEAVAQLQLQLQLQASALLNPGNWRRAWRERQARVKLAAARAKTAALSPEEAALTRAKQSAERAAWLRARFAVLTPAHWRGKRAVRAAAARAAAIEEHSLMDALTRHWGETDVLLRQHDAKDSIFELERVRKLVLEDFRDHEITPLADGFPRMRSGKMAPRDRKDLARSLHQLLRPAEHMLDTELLRRLFFAATTADMYRRHNKELRHKVALAHRDGVSVLRELRLRIAALEQQLKRARRESWCLAQTRLWEPHRNLHFIAKPLVLDEQQALVRAAAEQPEQDDSAAAAARPLRPRRAPQSPFLDLGDESLASAPGVGGMARLVDKLECAARDRNTRRGLAYSDTISREF